MYDTNAARFWIETTTRAIRNTIAAECRLGRHWSTKVVATLIGVAGLAVAPACAAENSEQNWIGTWSATPEMLVGAGQYADQTLRLIVHTSMGGSRVRIKISNTFGPQSLVIGTAHVALREAGARIVPGTDRALLFGGNSSFTIPSGSLAVSDPVYLDVPALSDLAVSIYLPTLSTASTTHLVAQQTSYVAATAGDFTYASDLPGATLTSEWDFLTGVDVMTSRQTAAIVTLGDSLTDGIGSTSDANKRWPDFLAARLQAESGPDRIAVLNKAITGDRLLHSGPTGLEFFGLAALARFDRDVLAQTGVKYLIVLLGLNDIAQPGIVAPDSEEVSAGDVIAGQLQLIARAHEKGIAVYGCTLTPFKNSLIAPGFYTPEKEAKREAVNEWIRSSGAFDAVIDFDRVLRDPANPLQILAAYDSGDHTHPNDAGYRAIANSIDLNLFRNVGSW